LESRIFWRRIFIIFFSGLRFCGFKPLFVGPATSPAGLVRDEVALGAGVRLRLRR
jgi:hypothetical protein